MNCSNRNAHENINEKIISSKWCSHKRFISNINNYEAKGTIIYSTKLRKKYFYFVWYQIDNNKFKFVLNDIIGFLKIQIYFVSNLFIITDNYGNKHFLSNENLKNLIERLIGIPINLNDLSKWLIGLPGSNNKLSDYILNSQGYINRIVNCNDLNYTVNYLSYYKNNIPELPSTIELCYHDVKIKFKINNWNVNDAKMAFSR